jgi:hypothetical protein
MHHFGVIFLSAGSAAIVSECLKFKLPKVPKMKVFYRFNLIRN